jgi:hypothetical protein
LSEISLKICCIKTVKISTLESRDGDERLSEDEAGRRKKLIDLCFAFDSILIKYPIIQIIPINLLEFLGRKITRFFNFCMFILNLLN